MMPRKFDRVYFENRVDHFQRLKEYLSRPRNRLLNMNKTSDCKQVRTSALRINGRNNSRHVKADLSIGKFIKSFGGIDKFLTTPVIKILPAVATMAFIDILNAKEKYYFSMLLMPIDRCIDIYNALYSEGYREPVNNVDDHLVTRYFKDITSRSIDQIDSGLEMFEEQFYEPRSARAEEAVRYYLLRHMQNKVLEEIHSPDDHIVPDIDSDTS